MQANRNSHTTSTKCQYQAANSKPRCCFGVNWPQRAEQADDEENRADDDVRAVEAGGHEKRGAVHVAGIVEGRVNVFQA